MTTIALKEARALLAAGPLVEWLNSLRARSTI